MRHLYLALIIAAATLSTANAGEVYKWKDKNGVVHYGEFEPPNRKSTTIETPTSKPAAVEGETGDDESESTQNQAAPNEDSVQKKKKMLENINEEKAKKQEAKLKAADETQAVERRCNSLKSRLTILERGGRLSEAGPNGEVHYLTEAEVKARITETRNVINKDCKK